MDWVLNNFWFKSFFLPFFDISLLTFLLYKGYRILYQTKAIPLLRGIFFMSIIYAVALRLKLETLSWILTSLGPGIVAGLAVVFQPELRKIFAQIGQKSWFTSLTQPRTQDIEAVLQACYQLSKMRRGALITFLRNVGLNNLVEQGISLNAELSSVLILTIFSYDTPLHDGGIIIQGGRILSAGCFYPLSENTTISKSFGTRHRASLGLSEESDAITIVVSEETGATSLTYNGILHYDLNEEELRSRLKDLLNFKDEAVSSKKG